MRELETLSETCSFAQLLQAGSTFVLQIMRQLVRDRPVLVGLETYRCILFEATKQVGSPGKVEHKVLYWLKK